MAIVSAVLACGATPVFETFAAPAFDRPVSGVRYGHTDQVSPIPLGALGTGFVEMTSSAAFGATTARNQWLKPEAMHPSSALMLGVHHETLETLSALLENGRLRPPGTCFWGHFPAADYDLGELQGVRVHLRAFSGLAPHDYRLSNLPAVFFRFRLVNTTDTPAPVEVGLRWAAEEGEAAADGAVGELRQTMGGYAISARSDGWSVTSWAEASACVVTRASRMLAAGEESMVTVVLAWRFPSWDSSDGERLRHHYAATYGDARAAVEEALGRADEAERALVAWQSRIYAAKAPVELMDAVVNGLYVLARNSWWLDDGRFLQSESFTGCPITETFVCRFNGAFPLALMWPELEKSTMREMARHQAENGQIPFGLGAPLGSRTPMMNLQVPIVSTEYALVAWRNVELWRDDAYLAEVYPSVKKALRFAMTLDTDGDGLVNEAPGSEEGFPANQYYDIWPWWGTSAYTGSLSLAAWRAGETLADRAGDGAFAEELRTLHERAAKSFEEKLWTGTHYRLYSGDANHPASDTSLTNALCGQWFAHASGLGDILPRAHVEKTIDTVMRLNVGATAFGAVNGARPDGTPDESFKDHSAVITIGEVWNFCAMAASSGNSEAGLELFRRSYENIALRQKTPWNIPWSLDRETGAIKWGIHYYSNPCVWTVLRAVDETTYRHLAGVQDAS